MSSEKEHLDDMRSEGDLNISPRRREWVKEHIDTETQHWLDLDARYFLHQSLSTPCLNVLSHCEGTTLTDLQGRRFMDFHGNNVHQVGFANPRVINAIRKQMEELAFCTRRYTNIPAIRLAEELAQLAPGNLNKILLAPGGTTAVGMALKLARLVTGRFKTISMWDSFHGASLDAISVGGEAIFRRDIGPLMPGTEHVPPPDCYRCLWGCSAPCTFKCVDYIEYVLDKEGDVAALIGETVRSTSVIPPRGYWERVRSACDKHDTLLILDEIPHCLGRTGKTFTCEHFDVVLLKINLSDSESVDAIIEINDKYIAGIEVYPFQLVPGTSYYFAGRENYNTAVEDSNNWNFNIKGAPGNPEMKTAVERVDYLNNRFSYLSVKSQTHDFIEGHLAMIRTFQGD